MNGSIRKNDGSLTKLGLNGNPIGNEKAKAIADALTTNTKLTLLDLSSTQIGNAGAVAISSALSNNKQTATFFTAAQRHFVKGLAPLTKQSNAVAFFLPIFL